MRKLIITALCICLTFASGVAEEPGSGIPDLTKGGELTRINERWVGPLGIFCGMWRARQRSDDQMYIKQLLVQQIDKGSPAEGILEVGDVILGADGTGAAQVPLFEGAPWTLIPIAEAITEAEARDPALLKLLVWREVKEAPKAKKNPVKEKSLDDLILNKSDNKGSSLLDAEEIKIPQTGTQVQSGKRNVNGKTFTVTIQLDALGSVFRNSSLQLRKEQTHSSQRHQSSL